MNHTRSENEERETGKRKLKIENPGQNEDFNHCVNTIVSYWPKVNVFIFQELKKAGPPFWQTWIQPVDAKGGFFEIENPYPKWVHQVPEAALIYSLLNIIHLII